MSLKQDSASLLAAIRLQPGNAGFRDRLGQYESAAQQWPEAASSFAEAAKLNPHNSLYWLSLASADVVLGRLAYRDALEQALYVDPTEPQAAWVASGIYFAAGDAQSALTNLRGVLEHSPSLSLDALQLCWQIKPDAAALLHDTIPANSAVYSSFLSFLISRKETVPAETVWNQMVRLGQPVRSADVFDYVRYLVGNDEPLQAGRVWRQAADFNLSELKPYEPARDNLVVNGNFALKMLNAGFDWNWVQRPGVELSLDPTEPLSGSPTLLIAYDSRGLDDSGIAQMIPVEPDTPYQFSAWFKTRQMEGAGGPHFLLQDFYSGKIYFDSDDLKDSDAWKRINGRFQTSSQTRMLSLKIVREPAGSPIRGKLWIGNVKLTPAEVQ